MLPPLCAGRRCLRHCRRHCGPLQESQHCGPLHTPIRHCLRPCGPLHTPAPQAQYRQSRVVVTGAGDAIGTLRAAMRLALAQACGRREATGVCFRMTCVSVRCRVQRAARAGRRVGAGQCGCWWRGLSSIYLYVYIYLDIYIYIYTYAHIYIHRCWWRGLSSIYLYVYIYLDIHTYRYRYIHTHIYTYIGAGGEG